MSDSTSLDSADTLAAHGQGADAATLRPSLLSRLISERAVWLGAASVALSILGTLLLPDESARLWGVLLILVACAAALLAWGGQRWPDLLPAYVAPTTAPTPQTLRRILTVPLLGFAASALLILVADALFVAMPGETFGVAGWLWVLGMLVLAVSALWPRRADANGEVAATVPTHGPQGESQVATTFDATQVRRGLWPTWEICLFAGIALLALTLRVWDLSGVPANIYPDEIMTGEVATQSYAVARPAPIFSTVWSGIDLPALWFFIVSVSLHVGDSTLAALRLPAAVFGAATVVPLYGLVRGVWGRTAAITASTILAFSASNLHYSRIALNNIVPQFFWATCFFFLVRGLRTRRWSDWAIAGLAGGLSEHSYYGTRLLPFILAAFCLYLLVLHWRRARLLVGHVGALALGYIVGFGPLLAYYLLHPGLYFGRGAGMLIWNRVPLSLDDLQQMWNTLWPVAAENMLGISVRGSQDIVYFAPLLLPIEAALLPLGMALLIWRWRHPAAFLVLLAGVGVWFVGGTLALYAAAPFLAHWTPAFPAFYIALALPVAALANSVRHPDRVRWLAPVVLGVALAGLLWANVSFYFGSYYADPESLKVDYYRAAQTQYEMQTAQSRYQASLGPGYRIYVLGSGSYSYDPTTTQYLVRGQQRTALANPDTDLPIQSTSGERLAFIFLPGSEQHLERVRTLYPGGRLEEMRTPRGKLLFSAYVLAPR
jgi:4-amino-4-deoxy-L-arabinose transferase-like glycosyltransferase